jgi:hypothetical protein
VRKVGRAIFAQVRYPAHPSISARFLGLEVCGRLLDHPMLPLISWRERPLRPVRDDVPEREVRRNFRHAVWHPFRVRRPMSESQQPLDVPLESPVLSDAIVPVPKAKPGRKRLASLCATFVVLIAVAGYLYWSLVHDQQTTARIEKTLSADGIQILYSKSEPSEADLSPFHSLASTVRVCAVAGNITDAHLPIIREINQDLSLMLNNCPVSDSGMAILEGKQNVRWLELRQTKVTNEGLRHLRGMGLEALDLSTTHIGDAGLAALGELDFPELKTLALEHLNVTDEGIAHLAHFKSLEFLSIADTKVTKAGIKHLQLKIPSCTILGGS